MLKFRGREDGLSTNEAIESLDLVIRTAAANPGLFTGAVPIDRVLEAVLGPWLSERERTAVLGGTFRDLEWGSRLRYLEWYAWLHDKAGV